MASQKTIKRAERRRRKMVNDPAYRKAFNRAKYLKRTGQPSEAHYRSVLEGQGGGCAVCGVIPANGKLDVHYVKGELRGLLCHRCRVLVGIVAADPQRLCLTSAYLGL